MTFKKGLFLFHRDFRLKDNTAFYEAQKQCDQLYTMFVFTPSQVTPQNAYKSKNSVEFMIQSIMDLEQQIKENDGKLILQYGNLVSVLRSVLPKLSINALFFNYDLTPYARDRSAQVEKLCETLSVDCLHYHDYYLLKPGDVLTGSNTMYHKFTPFYEKYMLSGDIHEPVMKAIKPLASYRGELSHNIDLNEAMTKYVGRTNPKLFMMGGRDQGLGQLKTALKTMKKYDETRDIMSIETSGLSAYLKYGCISIREVYSGFKKKYGKFHELVRQLIWRDFYAHLLYFYPENLGNLYNKKMSELKWSANKNHLEAWKKGETGVPLIDAGMRQMNETGYMHNRCRMLVATYLVKILHIDWREGEKYFAQKLVDYDVASNSGNWQAIVGGGVYAMPWFRVMSPWAQSEEYDPEAVYIKTWVKELASIEPKVIHKWYKYCKTREYKEEYRCPIVDYKKEREVFLDSMK